MGFKATLHQFARLLREPQRIKRLHYSKVVAWLHQVVEASDQSVLKSLFGVSEEQFSALERDLVQDQEFRESLEERFHEVRGKRIRLFGEKSESDYHPTMRMIYYCVRLSQPRIAVDTGVLDGFSSAAILKAMRDNEKGFLYSIDLPARREVDESSDKMLYGYLPTGHDPGWVIPDALTSRWEVRLGSSRNLLEPLLEELGTIDYFLHDSLHTAEHMMWEYVTAWSVLADSGLLMSDDVFWNRAFRQFSRQAGPRPEFVRGMGMLLKGDSSRAAGKSSFTRPESQFVTQDRVGEAFEALVNNEAWRSFELERGS